MLTLDGKKVLRTVKKPKEPKWNLAAIGEYAFNGTFFDVYLRLKPSSRNEMALRKRYPYSLIVDSRSFHVASRVGGKTRTSRRTD